MPKHIRVIGPSSHIEHKMIGGAIQWLEEQGFQVTVADQVYTQSNQSAGSVSDKINALHDAFSDNDVDIIMTSCGGNGAIHLLDHINFDLIRNNPKPFIGFSDITILLNAIYTHTGIPTYHGPTLTQIQKPIPGDQLAQFLSILNGNHQDIEWTGCASSTETINTQGRLFGGNLSVFQALIGTPHINPKDEESLILFFEDVGDEISRYDRMLAHIRQTGLMHKASAILFGDFHCANNPARVPFGKTVNEVIKDLTSDLNIPIITNCPFGHRGKLWTLPVGKTCSISKHNDDIKITF